MYGTIPPETLAEILLFLDEHEEFNSLKKLGTVSRQAFSNTLKELSQTLKAESKNPKDEIQVSDLQEIPAKFKKILAQLTPQETKILLKGLSA